MKTKLGIVACLLLGCCSCFKAQERKTHERTVRFAHDNIVQEHYSKYQPNYGEERKTYYYIDQNLVVEEQKTYFPWADVVYEDSQCYFLDDNVTIEGHRKHSFHELVFNAVVEATVVEKKIEPPINHFVLQYNLNQALDKASGHLPFSQDYNFQYHYLTLDEIQAAYEISHLDYDEQEYYINNPVVRFELKDALPEEMFYLFERSVDGKFTPVADAPTPIKASELTSFLIQLYNYQAGQPVDYIAMDQHGRFAIAHLVPKPIQIKGEGKKMVTIEAENASRSKFLVHLTGFEPFELVYVYLGTESGCHSLKREVTMSREGQGFLTIYPAMPEKWAGRSIVEVKGFTSPSEILVAQVEWGHLSVLYPQPPAALVEALPLFDQY